MVYTAGIGRRLFSLYPCVKHGDGPLRLRFLQAAHHSPYLDAFCLTWSRVPFGMAATLRLILRLRNVSFVGELHGTPAS